MVKATLDGKFLSIEKLEDIINDNKALLAKYAEQEEYYKGKNRYILYEREKEIKRNTKSSRKIWSIVCSYGRKIVKTIAGYMYKPGLITYTYKNTEDEKSLKEVFKTSNETILNNKIGTYCSVNGLAYELHYYDSELKYYITMLKAKEGIAVYNYDVDPKMIAFIHIYEYEDTDQYQVYYPGVIRKYERVKDSDNNGKIKLRLIDENVIGFTEIPVIEYKNNAENISDIEIVKSMIDAYDTSVSTVMIEFDKFAFAYLRIVGSSLSKEQVDKVRDQQIIANLENKDAVTYLTKDIPTDFIEKTADRLKHEIHRQSFIPDIDDIKFSGAASGVAIDKFIYLMEYTASDKEAYFKKGLEERFDLINSINQLKDRDGIKIDFSRNIPSSDLVNAQVYSQLDGKGISRETMMDHLITWVENPKEELKNFEKEADKRAKKTQAMFGDNTDEEEESQGDTQVSEE